MSGPCILLLDGSDEWPAQLFLDNSDEWRFKLIRSDVRITLFVMVMSEPRFLSWLCPSTKPRGILLRWQIQPSDARLRWWMIYARERKAYALYLFSTNVWNSHLWFWYIWVGYTDFYKEDNLGGILCRNFWEVLCNFVPLAGFLCIRISPESFLTIYQLQLDICTTLGLRGLMWSKQCKKGILNRTVRLRDRYNM